MVQIKSVQTRGIGCCECSYDSDASLCVDISHTDEQGRQEQACRAGHNTQTALIGYNSRTIWPQAEPQAPSSGDLSLHYRKLQRWRCVAIIHRRIEKATCYCEMTQINSTNKQKKSLPFINIHRWYLCFFSAAVIHSWVNMHIHF